MESFHLGIKVSGVETQLRMGARGTSCPQTAPWFFEDNTVWTKATFFFCYQLGIDVLLASDSPWDPWNACGRARWSTLFFLVFFLSWKAEKAAEVAPLGT